MSETLLYVATQDNAVKLSWNFPDFAGTYCAGLKAIEDAVSRVRSQLENIANLYVDPAASYVPLFRGLAEAGADLQTALFTEENNTFRDDCLQSLRSQEPNSRLRIVSDSTVEVPWGFVFLGETTRNLRPQLKYSDFRDFLLFRYRIRIRFQNGNRSPARPILRSSVRTLLALHEDRFKAVQKLLNADDLVAAKLAALLNSELGATCDWDDCQAKWESMRDGNGIFYVFAHRDADAKLCLAEQAKVSKDDWYKYELAPGSFSTKFKKGTSGIPGASNTLCFINGCRTAGGGWGSRLLTATSGVGFHGFIGSEAEVSSYWATRYAIDFLYAILEEEQSVDIAFDAVRDRCFPMSLWYSCYAQPTFQIVKDI